MAKRSDDRDWREQVIRSLPTMEANTGPGATGFQPAAAADIGPLTFHGSRMPDDPAELLDGLPLVKMTLLHQRALACTDTDPRRGARAAARSSSPQKSYR